MRWTAQLGPYGQNTVVRTAPLDGELTICVSVDLSGFHCHMWLGLEETLEFAQALRQAALEVAEGDALESLEVPF